MVGGFVDQVVEVDGPFILQQVLIFLPDLVEHVEEVAGASLVPLLTGALFDFLGELVYSSRRFRRLLVHSSWRFTDREGEGCSALLCSVIGSECEPGLV